MAALKVTVTGGSGFLGRYVVAAFRRRGYDVFVPRRAMYDLTNESNVMRMYDDSHPEVVVHLAAVVGGLGANIANPAKFLYDNLLMGLFLIEHGHRRKVRKFVTIGTTCEYPNLASVPFQEDTLWDGYPDVATAPYGIAKKTILVQGQVYRQQFGFDVIHLLPTNLYGPEDNFDAATSHVVPALIRKCVAAADARASEVVCWGDGSASREFLYVEDCAEAIALATDRYSGPDPVNLGSGREVSMRELIDMVCALVPFRGKVVWDRSMPNGQPRRCLDVTRAADLFGFRARTDFREGLARTIDWYRAQTIPCHQHPLPARYTP
jgi:GDP-L-fucose synthase